MKRCNYLLLLFLLAFLFLGCEKKEEKYSCDDIVHNWTVENLKTLEGLSRSELALLPFEYQRAAIRAFAPEKRSEIWNEKMDLVLMQQWDDDEYLLMKEMKNRLKPEFFDLSNIEQTHLYLNDWSVRMFEETNMDSLSFVISFFYIGTWEEIELLLYPDDTEGSDLKKPGGQRVPDPPGGWGVDCDCSWDITCSLINMGTCDNDKCDGTESGCKLLGLYSCNYRCTGEDPSL